jgi:hypothetical protein
MLPAHGGVAVDDLEHLFDCRSWAELHAFEVPFDDTRAGRWQLIETPHAWNFLAVCRDNRIWPLMT